MPTRPAQRDLHLAAALFGDHDRVEAAAAQVERHAAGLTDRVPDSVEQLGVGLNQPPGAEDPSRLLVRQRRQDDVTGRSASCLGPDQGGHHHRDASLHVESPAAPQVPVDDVATEGALAPVLVDGGDDVDVPLQEQRRRLAAALHARDEVWTSGRALVPGGFDARLP